MKYLLPILLLISTFSHAQESFGNYTKVTAIRVVNEKGYGPCSIAGFIEQAPIVSTKLQAVQSDDEQLAFALVSLKKEAKQWEKKPLACAKTEVGSYIAVPNMFVVQINRYRDTIYTTSGNASLFFPDEEAEYIDASGKLNGLLDENLCFFFERNYYDEFITHKKDSIPVSQVLINGKPVFGHTRKSFEKNIAKFGIVTTDSIFGKKLEVEKAYMLNNIRSKFGRRLTNITAVHLDYNFPDKATLSVGGLQLDDPEEKLYEAYPCTSEFKNWGASLRDLNGNYYYELQFTEDKGYALFYIRNKRIHEIEVSFPE